MGQQVQYKPDDKPVKEISLYLEEEFSSPNILPTDYKLLYMNWSTLINNLLDKQQLTTLLFTSILGIRPEIIKTRESEVISFSNVSSASEQSRVGSKISSSIRSIDRYVQELTQIGIKGSVANDRNLSPIHKAPVRIQNLSVSLDLFETGIKVVDLLTPYKKGGKIGLFGGAGVGKTVVIMEL